MFSKIKLQALAWRIAITWFFFFSGVSLASALITALTNVNWSTMDVQAKILMGLSVFVSWGTTMMAFFSNATKKIQTEIASETVQTQQTIVQTTTHSGTLSGDN